jgi:hypothetical protein
MLHACRPFVRLSQGLGIYDKVGKRINTEVCRDLMAGEFSTTVKKGLFTRIKSNQIIKVESGGAVVSDGRSRVVVGWLLIAGSLGESAFEPEPPEPEPASLLASSRYPIAYCIASHLFQFRSVGPHIQIHKWP